MNMPVWGKSMVRALPAAVMLAACGDESTAPDLVDLAGTYRLGAAVLTLPGTAPLDLVQAGTVLQLRISSAGQTSGTVEVPANTVGNAEPIVGDLTGSVIQTAPGIRFGFENGFFLDDLDYALTTQGLSANGVVDGTSAQVTLIRIAP